MGVKNHTHLQNRKPQTPLPTYPPHPHHVLQLNLYDMHSLHPYHNQSLYEVKQEKLKQRR